MNERVMVNGFLLDIFIPSEERLALKVDLSTLSKYEHVDWVGELQDMLRSIDDNYRHEKGIKVAGKGRSVRVRYVRGDGEMRRKIAEFYAFPSSLINNLKNVRHVFYEKLNSTCIILQEEKVGNSVRKLYFLPAPLAPDLMNDVRDCNAELELIRREVAAFQETPQWMDIISHVRKVWKDFNGFSPSLPNLTVSPIPLSLSKEFFKRYLEEEGAKAMAEVDEAKRQGLEELRREMETKRREMLEAIKRDLQGRFTAVMAMAEEAVKLALRGRRAGQSAAKKMRVLSNLVKGIGVEFDEKPLNALADVLLATSSRDLASLKSAVSELAQSLGIQPSGDPAKDIEVASKVARGHSLLLLTID